MSTQPIQLVPAAKVWNDPHTPSRREYLWIKEGKKCHWCGIPTRLCPEPDLDQATIEHIIPRCRGGTDAPENLASACNSCNGRRAYEDSQGLPEGAMLGRWPLSKKSIRPATKPTRPPDAVVFRAERDNLLQEVIKLREKQKTLEIALEKRGLLVKYFQTEINKKQEEIRSITVWKLIRTGIGIRLKRLGAWLLT